VVAAVQTWTIGVITAVAGLVSGFVSAAANAWLSNRSKVSEELREQRLKAYPDVWGQTVKFSHWPRDEVTYGELADFERCLRAWYYSVGGLYMSPNARRRYEHVQQLGAASRDGREAGRHVTSDAYEDLMEACSAFRTALSEDLESRRQGSLAYATQRSLARRKQMLADRRRLRRAVARPHEEAPLQTASPASQ
jgi:hypothetical protein